MTRENVYDVEARSYELDPYGHLNNGVYVNWLEHGRLCYLRDRGMTYDSIPGEEGVQVVVVRLEIDYRAQVRLGERLRVVSRILRLGNSSFTFDQQIAFEDGRPAASAAVTMVCVGPDGRSVPIPPRLRERLAG